MSAFTYELATVTAAVERAHPNHPEGAYAIPWYLVVGNPGSGRSTALHSMNLTWEGSDGPLTTGLPQQLCTFWKPKEAVFIEPEATVLGAGRQPEQLKELCLELRTTRPREPLDGLILILNINDFIDLDEKSIEDYANGLRRYMLEIGQTLQADVPTYVVLTRYDAVWGFAEVFQWTPERKKEDPWGFTLPPETPSQESLPPIKVQLEGLNARLEAFCLARLCSEDPVEQRVRSFQHLAEVRALMEKLRLVFNVLAMANAYERAPWIRAVALGSALPGSGDHMRAGVARFFNMGLSQGAPSAVTSRPGGLPLHAFMGTVVLPERDIVPLRSRWREDKVFLFGMIAAALFYAATLVMGLVFAMAAAPERREGARPPPPPAHTAAPKR
jgi:type VI protein secretion system component VasK